MGYNEKDDKLIKQFTLEDGDGGELLFSIMKYGKAEPKLQVTRMYNKRDKTVGYGKMGRLTYAEVKFMKENLEEIMDSMLESKSESE